MFTLFSFVFIIGGKEVFMLPFVFNREVNRYFHILCPEGMPSFLIPYCHTPSMERLEGVGYFCGADYHQMESHRPKYFYSRYDHSLACALMMWHFTKNRQQTILALLHDIGTPAFSHALDYGLKDSKYQESSERDIVSAIKDDSMLEGLLYLDGIDIEKIILKDYSLIDNERPKLCVDRLDGILAPNLIWSQKITIANIQELYSHLVVLNNEENKLELGFDDVETAKQCFAYNQIINQLTESKEDRLAMSLLGDILCYGIKSGCFTQDDLYHLTEYEIIEKIKKSSNNHLKHYWNTYCCLKEVYCDPSLSQPYYTVSEEVKKRTIDPLVVSEEIEQERLSQWSEKVRLDIFEYENQPLENYPYIKLRWNKKRK